MIPIFNSIVQFRINEDIIGFRRCFSSLLTISAFLAGWRHSVMDDGDTESLFLTR